MAEPKFVIESGLQLLARLTKKPSIDNFYPILLNLRPESGDLIEICYESETSWLLIDMISEAILPNKANNDIEVLLFNTDGNLSYDVLINVLKHKIFSRHEPFDNNTKKETILQDSLRKLHMLEIFDANQFLVTLHNLDNMLTAYPNICLVIFNSLTAFYWSEQGIKIGKMDSYLKNLIHIIQKFNKEYKITCIYTRPQYFIFSKYFDGHNSSHVTLNQQIILSYLNNDRNIYKVNVKTMDKEFVRYFKITDGTIKWDDN